MTGDYDPFVAAQSGVDLFFVISGFIICSAAIKHESNPWRFLVKRCGRIFPVYWFVLALSAFVTLWIAPIVGTHWMPERPAIDYILLLTLINRYVPQAWTLSYEIYFYVCMSVVLLARPRSFWFVIGSLMLCQACLVAYALLSGGNPDASVFSSPMVLEFGIGCGVAYLRSREYRRYAELALLIGMSGFAAGSIWI